MQAANAVVEKDIVASGEDKIAPSSSASGGSVGPAAVHVQPEPSQPPAAPILAQPDDALMNALPSEHALRSPHFNPESPNYNKEDWPDSQPHQGDLLFPPVRPDDDDDDAIKPSSTTGLVPVEPVVVPIDDETHESDSCEAQPPSPPCKKPEGKKSRKGNQGPLIAKPPVPAPHVMSAAEAHVEAHGSLSGDVEAQRALKRDLKEKAEQQKLEAEQKREEANQKKREKSEQAIQKAKDKLEKLMAKSQALEMKKSKKAVKRKLDGEFAEAADDHQVGTPVSPAPAPKKKRQAIEGNPKQASSSVRLTPKAKNFALKTSPDKKAGDARMVKAQTSLQTLRKLDLEGLKLPPDPFCKKTLACSFVFFCSLHSWSVLFIYSLHMFFNMLMQQHAIIHSFHPKIPYLVHAC